MVFHRLVTAFPATLLPSSLPRIQTHSPPLLLHCLAAVLSHQLSLVTRHEQQLRSQLSPTLPLPLPLWRGKHVCSARPGLRPQRSDDLYAPLMMILMVVVYVFMIDAR